MLSFINKSVGVLLAVIVGLALAYSSLGRRARRRWWRRRGRRFSRRRRWWRRWISRRWWPGAAVDFTAARAAAVDFTVDRWAAVDFTAARWVGGMQRRAFQQRIARQFLHVALSAVDRPSRRRIISAGAATSPSFNSTHGGTFGNPECIPLGQLGLQWNEPRQLQFGGQPRTFHGRNA